MSTKTDNAISQRAAKIDARFTEREKTVRMGRDPAAEVGMDPAVATHRWRSSKNPLGGPGLWIYGFGFPRADWIDREIKVNGEWVRQ